MSADFNHEDTESTEVGIGDAETILAESSVSSVPPWLKKQWRSLDEYADTPEFREWLMREFPPLASEWSNEFSRRHFLKLMGASFALAGVSGCTRQPLEKIVPYVKQPEELIPGKPLYFATALTLAGYARGVLVESHEGRPTKIEGNPEHPASLGASDVFMQAAVLDLYDPDRSKNVVNNGAVSTWDAFLSEMTNDLRSQQTSGGAGIRILTQTVTSPTLDSQLHAFLAKFPNAKWHQWEPLGDEARPIYHFDKADVIVSLGADFLGVGPAQLCHTRDFTSRRRGPIDLPTRNRLYVAESTPTLTGAAADHRLLAKPSALRTLVEAFANELKLTSTALDAEYDSAFVNTASADLQAHAGRSIFLVGADQSANVRALAERINSQLGNASTTIDYPPPTAVEPGASSLADLIEEMRIGKIGILLILGGNPVFDSPADVPFAEAMKKVGLRVHLASHENETSAECDWHIPEAHALETWSDARAFDGTATIMQPLIEPLYGGKSAHEFLAAINGDAVTSGYEIVRNFWRTQHEGDDFEKFWRRSLHDGVVAQSILPNIPRATPPVPQIQIPNSKIQNLELLIRPDPHLYDGRFANNAWLQELPKPFTKLTWDNAALISPATALRLKLSEAEVVDLKFRGRSVRAPVLILPGQADDCVTVHLGCGRTRAGRVGNGVGFNAYALRTSDALWGGPGLEIVKTGERHFFATTQKHQNMEGRDLVRAGTVAEFQKNPNALARGGEPAPARDESLYPPVEYKGHAWGMAIDLNTCIGCNVCTIACQAENNIPVVGKEQVARGREMHWIRVDNYFEGAPENPAIHFQPVPCMHCENAPCELVCPVAATVHSSEGLNEMVYNRCIGTRYCSNNCPYKVRRFNFLEYGGSELEAAPVLRLLRNPDVTVRTRGVMEKCTYCVQRIQRVRIESEKKNAPIHDGEIVPACAQACPAEAIIFGDINDPQSRVSNLKASPLNYGLLAELNTRPRTTYLAKLRNPNPEMRR